MKIKAMLFVAFVVSLVNGSCQNQATFIEPLCWEVSTELDSTVKRISQISASANAIRVVGYVNNNGQVISVPGGAFLKVGACECCYGKFPPVNPDLTPTVSITSFSQPTFNPINPGSCTSNMFFQTVGVTNVADITVLYSGVPVTFAWDSMTGQGSASATQSWGSGTHDWQVTITTTDCNPCTDSRTVDCG